MSDQSPDSDRVAQVVHRIIGAPSALVPPAAVEQLIRWLTAVVVSVRADEHQRWRAIRDVVDAQVEDGGVWFTAQTAAEAYLQQELRTLHTAVAVARAALPAAR